MTRSTQRALRSIQRALRQHSEGIHRALKECSESTKLVREKSDFVIPSEPKILRLVTKRILVDMVKKENLI